MCCHIEVFSIAKTVSVLVYIDLYHMVYQFVNQKKKKKKNQYKMKMIAISISILSRLYNDSSIVTTCVQQSGVATEY